PGSDDIQTETIRKYIPQLVRDYQITTFFDVPCGDFYWMSKIADTIPNYIGADIVKSLIDKNTEQYNYKFLHFDITQDAIPSVVELIFSRDMLVHFPLEYIRIALRNIKKSGAKYLLMTTFINRSFVDIGTIGEWRAISFFNPPF